MEQNAPWQENQEREVRIIVSNRAWRGWSKLERAGRQAPDLFSTSMKSADKCLVKCKEKWQGLEGGYLIDWVLPWKTQYAVEWTKRFWGMLISDWDSCPTTASKKGCQGAREKSDPREAWVAHQERDSELEDMIGTRRSLMKHFSRTSKSSSRDWFATKLYGRGW